MNDFISAITNVGFPIALSVYLLYRFEKKIEEMSKLVGGKDGVLDRCDEILKVVKEPWSK